MNKKGGHFMQKQPNGAVILLISLGIILALGGLFYYVFIRNIAGSTQPILGVANRVKVPEDWKLESEQIEPPRFICLGDVKCPSLQRTWRTPQEVSLTELQALSSSANLSLSPENSCDYRASVSGGGPICILSGSEDELEVSITYWHHTTPQIENYVVLGID